jgi:hypothetical protein
MKRRRNWSAQTHFMLKITLIKRILDTKHYIPELGVIKLHLFSSSAVFVVMLMEESNGTTFSNLADFDLP